LVDFVRSDLRALPTWRARARLVREHLFPDPAFVLESHGVSSRMLLPVLYATRIAGGLAGWLRRSAD